MIVEVSKPENGPMEGQYVILIHLFCLFHTEDISHCLNTGIRG